MPQRSSVIQTTQPTEHLTQPTLNAFQLGATLALTLFAELGWAGDPLDNWTSRSALKTGTELLGVAYGNGLFVAVGGGSGTASEGIILTSSTGTNWVQRRAGLNYLLQGVTYGANQFVAVGYGGTIATSTDGATWVKRESGTPDFGFYSVIRGGNQFVAVGRLGNGPAIETSSDGVT